MLKLYGYWRSTAAYRVRIALNIKRLDYESIAIHLVKDGGQQHSENYRELNPQGLVPALETENGDIITQSMAIVEFIDAEYPGLALLPGDNIAKAQCRAFAQMVACDIHPLNNLRVLKYLKGENFDQVKVDKWYKHWIDEGFQAIEKQLKLRNTKFMSADHPCISDIFLVAQIYNARRFEIPLDVYPNILEIDRQCAQIEAFDLARPEMQADAND